MKNHLSADNAIGQRLKAEMKKRGISSARLATDAGVKTSFIYDVISGKSANPSTVKLARVADSLGVSLKSLVETSALPPDAPAQALGESSDFILLPHLVVDISHAEPTVTTVQHGDEPGAFRRSWISQHLKLDPDTIQWLQIAGDSMEPTLHHGDYVLVDTKNTNPTPPGVFILYDGYGLSAKRLELLTHTEQPRIRVLSDNTQYTIYEKSVDDICIIGRVVWFARGM